MINNFLVFLLAGALSLACPAYAKTKVSINAEEIFSHGNTRALLYQSLENPEFLKELQKRGVNAAEARTRLAAMTDDELNQVASGVQRQLGGEVVIISVTTLLLIRLIVLLVT